MEISACKVFDVTNVVLLLEKCADVLSLPSYLMISVRNLNMLQRIFSDFAKTLNVIFGTKAKRVKTFQTISKQI